ncbi:hypothetical protein DV738_g294, partial [Chaetothyriales sp. CBS 135597]
MEDQPFVKRFREIRIGGRYQIREPLGTGSFGDVYLGRDVSNNQEVAIKLEHCSAGFPHLSQEIGIYEDLHGRPGIPQVLWHGSNCEYEVMVLELLGPNLEDLFQYCDRRFSLKTTLMLMDQLLHRIETIHRAGYLHRDIKPENCLMGTGRQGNTVFVTDLGLATDVPDSFPSDRPRTAPPRLSLVGTSYFASTNGHLAVTASRRDDLESLGYMALYFLHGSLPWAEIRASTRSEKHELIFKRKQTITVAELCDGAPQEFAVYMNYIRELGSHDRPDYKYLRSLFDGLFRREKFERDNVFDWTIREYERLYPPRAEKDLLPLGLLAAAQGHPMLVELKNGETLNGHLVNCDTWMNLTLKEVVQTSPEGDRFWRLAEAYVRGNNVSAAAVAVVTVMMAAAGATVEVGGAVLVVVVAEAEAMVMVEGAAGVAVRNVNISTPWAKESEVLEAIGHILSMRDLGAKNQGPAYGISSHPSQRQLRSTELLGILMDGTLTWRKGESPLGDHSGTTYMTASARSRGAPIYRNTSWRRSRITGTPSTKAVVKI